jgi:hypothetical protein
MEEMAEEYVKKNCDDSLYSFRGQELQEAFLAGYEAGKDEAEADLATVAYMQGSENMKKKTDRQLTEAKELLREFVKWANWQGNSKCPSFKSIQDKAEAFLKE